MVFQFYVVAQRKGRRIATGLKVPLNVGSHASKLKGDTK